MTREEVIQLALDIGLRAARTYKYRGSLEALTEPERKELEHLLEFANKIIERDEALLRQALEALEFEADGWEYPPPKTTAAIAALRAALAEKPAEQEPVGEVAEVAQGYDEGWTAIIETGLRKLQKGDKVYTAPQPAKREPLTDEELTDEELMAIIREAGKGSALRPMDEQPTSLRIARAVIAALRERLGEEE